MGTFWGLMRMRRFLAPGAVVVSALVVSALAVALLPTIAQAGQRDYDALVSTHAKANNVPEVLVHRVILRESRYQPNLVGAGGCIGLMQIKLGTARGLGYGGDAAGLRDPETNLTYGIKYLAGAYRAAKGDLTLAMHYFATGYYYVAKRQRTELASAIRLDSSGNRLPAAETQTAQPSDEDQTEASAQPAKP
jgi:soluble lytic murein transglycosylase-like protein